MSRLVTVLLSSFHFVPNEVTTMHAKGTVSLIVAAFVLTLEACGSKSSPAVSMKRDVVDTLAATVRRTHVPNFRVVSAQEVTAAIRVAFDQLRHALPSTGLAPEDTATVVSVTVSPIRAIQLDSLGRQVKQSEQLIVLFQFLDRPYDGEVWLNRTTEGVVLVRRVHK